MTPMSGAQKTQGHKKDPATRAGSVDDEVRYPVMDTWAIDAWYPPLPLGGSDLIHTMT
ncbi:hypothetical protein M2359_000326 [Gordonia amarae]|nr:hypothetical protein [Gordonia amarae]